MMELNNDVATLPHVIAPPKDAGVSRASFLRLCGTTVAVAALGLYSAKPSHATTDLAYGATIDYYDIHGGLPGYLFDGDPDTSATFYDNTAYEESSANLETSQVVFTTTSAGRPSSFRVYCSGGEFGWEGESLFLCAGDRNGPVIAYFAPLVSGWQSVSIPSTTYSEDISQFCVVIKNNGNEYISGDGPIDIGSIELLV